MKSDKLLIDLTDSSVIMPFRIDSKKRHENLITLLDYIRCNFKTNIHLLEADTSQKFDTKILPETISYSFIQDSLPYFYHTYYRNVLVKESNQPIIILWDIDCLCTPEQITDAVSAVKNKGYTMSLPYDGHVVNVISLFEKLFIQNLSFEVLNANLQKMPVMYGKFSTGGIVVLNKKAFMAAGAENERIKGWGPEDLERYKRMEINGHTIYHSFGPLFHLDHPRGETSRYLNPSVKIESLSALFDTCKICTYSNLVPMFVIALC